MCREYAVFGVWGVGPDAQIAMTNAQELPFRVVAQTFPHIAAGLLAVTVCYPTPQSNCIWPEMAVARVRSTAFRLIFCAQRHPQWAGAMLSGAHPYTHLTFAPAKFARRAHFG